MKQLAADKKMRSNRRGITIIEVMIVVTGAAMMLGLCAVSIQLLLKLSTDGQTRYSSAVALERLARQLRADAHASESAQVIARDKTAASPSTLRLLLKPDHLISYEPRDGDVVRTESQSGKTVRHESYRLARGAVARLELRTEASHRLVALVVSRSSGPRQVEPPRPLEVVAWCGKDRVAPLAKNGGKTR